MKKILLFMGYLAGFVVGAKYAKKPDTKWKKSHKNLSETTLEAGKDLSQVIKKHLRNSKKNIGQQKIKNSSSQRKKT